MTTVGPAGVTTAPLLEARGLTKRFPGVVALKQIDFQLAPAEVHALCGENGAGKSTLIKLLAGIHPAGSYEGELRVADQPVAFRSVRDAEAAGIAVITQELALVDELSIAENIFLGREPCKGLRIDWPEIRRRTRILLDDFGLALSPDTLVGDLGVGHKQLVEIIRALDKKTRVLVLDEPTAALTEQEVAVLLGHVRRLRSAGTACIYISHKLDEVFALADRITVLRDGSTIATLTTQATTTAEVIKHMVGREITDLFPKRAVQRRDGGEPLLAVSSLRVALTKGGPDALKDISFELRPGEVLGIGGLMGAGRTELLLHLYGAWGHRVAGNVFLKGETHAHPTPRASLERGLALVSEDRRRHGLILEQSVGFNLSLSSLSQFLQCTGKLDTGAEQQRNRGYFESLRIKAPGLDAAVG